MNLYNIRNATSQDINFLIEVIINAEKSSTEKCGLKNTFQLTENELKITLSDILQEEIDGCELSVSSFLISEFKGQAVGAVGGWIEGRNSNNLPSAIIKSNLLGYYLPEKSKSALTEISTLLQELQMEREPNAYELEYVYTREAYRGQGVARALIEAHEAIARNAFPPVCKMKIQVFGNNLPAIKAYQKTGLEITKEITCKNNLILSYLPSNKKIGLEKTIRL